MAVRREDNDHIQAPRADDLEQQLNESTARTSPPLEPRAIAENIRQITLSGAWAGVLAGVFVLLFAMITGVISGSGVLTPLRILAAPLLWQNAQTSVAAIIFSGLLFSLAISAALGFFFGLSAAIAFKRRSMAVYIVAGSIYGVTVWAVSWLFLLPITIPAIVTTRSASVSLITFLAYGIVIGILLGRYRARS